MGQARNRGTYEQRKALAIKRKKEEQARILEFNIDRRQIGLVKGRQCGHSWFQFCRLISLLEKGEL